MNLEKTNGMFRKTIQFRLPGTMSVNRYFSDDPSELTCPTMKTI